MKNYFWLFFFFLVAISYSTLCHASTTVLTSTLLKHTIASGNDEQVYGTLTSNQIILESGARAELFHFPGQNRIQIQSRSDLFIVYRSGTVVTFQGSDGSILKIPATKDPQTVTFNGEASRVLQIHNNRVMIDDQVITAKPSGIVNTVSQVAGMEFVYVENGCYDMGCGAWADSCDDEEAPVHEVCVDGFQMARYEVTVDQYREFLLATGDETGIDLDGEHCPVNNDNTYSLSGNNFGANGDQPMVAVNWQGAAAFADWLSDETGLTFRLPTEAEWEYAARSGGMEEIYAGGDDVDSVAWYGENPDTGSTYVVGTKLPNGLGLYDMSGNVWEWCSDWHASDYYENSPSDNPRGPSSGIRKVRRGGSWTSESGAVSCVNRSNKSPDYTGKNHGFRLIIEPFAGEITLPETGDVLMEINDPDGIVSATFTGLETSEGPSLPITSFTLNPKTVDPFTIHVEEDGRISSIEQTEMRMEFVDNADGTFNYFLYDNGGLVYSGSNIGIASEIQSNSLAIAKNVKAMDLLAVDDSSGIDCSLSRDEYEQSLEDLPVIKKNRKLYEVGVYYFAGLYYLSLQFDKKTENKEVRENYYRILMSCWAAIAELEKIEQAINDIKAQKMQEYDSLCQSVPEGLTCPGGAPVWQESDLDALDNVIGMSILGKEGYVNTSLDYNLLVEDRYGYNVSIQYKGEQNKAYTTFNMLLGYWEPYEGDYIVREVNPVRELEEYANEEVFLYTYRQHQYDSETYLGTYEAQEILGYSGNVIIEISSNDTIARNFGTNYNVYDNPPVTIIYNLYNEAKNILLEKCYEN